MWWLVALLVQGLTALVLLLWDLVALLADLHVETGKKIVAALWVKWLAAVLVQGFGALLLWNLIALALLRGLVDLQADLSEQWQLETVGRRAYPVAALKCSSSSLINADTTLHMSALGHFLHSVSGLPTCSLA